MQTRAVRDPARSSVATGRAQPTNRAGIRVGADGDRCEREAEAVARAVARRLGGGGREVLGSALSADSTRIRRVAVRDAPTSVVDETTARAVSGGLGAGRPLATGLRADMEAAFGGVDFASVRVHTGAAVARVNRRLAAVAFAHGSDVYFRDGLPDEHTRAGSELWAHELAHTAQQQGSGTRRIQRVGDRSPAPQYIKVRGERIDLADADRVAEAARWISFVRDECGVDLDSDAVVDELQRRARRAGASGPARRTKRAPWRVAELAALARALGAFRQVLSAGAADDRSRRHRRRVLGPVGKVNQPGGLQRVGPVGDHSGIVVRDAAGRRRRLTAGRHDDILTRDLGRHVARRVARDVLAQFVVDTDYWSDTRTPRARPKETPLDPTVKHAMDDLADCLTQGLLDPVRLLRDRPRRSRFVSKLRWSLWGEVDAEPDPPRPISIRGEHVTCHDQREAAEAARIIDRIARRYRVVADSQRVLEAQEADMRKGGAKKSSVLAQEHAPWNLRELRALLGAFERFDDLLAPSSARATRARVTPRLKAYGKTTDRRAVVAKVAGRYHDASQTILLAEGARPYSEFKAHETLVHEMVHAVFQGTERDFAREVGCWASRKKLRDRGEQPPTRYASEDLFEDIAESVTLYFGDPAHLLRVCPIRFRFIESEIRRWRQRRTKRPRRRVVRRGGRDGGIDDRPPGRSGKVQPRAPRPGREPRRRDRAPADVDT